MYNFHTTLPGDPLHLLDVVKLFYPEPAQSPAITLLADERDGLGHVVTVDGRPYFFARSLSDAANADRREAKLALYLALSEHSGRDLPWGSLTGVRPTKLMYEAMRKGLNAGEAAQTLIETYRISPARAALLEEIIGVQAPHAALDHKAYMLYVHIPFCPTRCSYCSFVSVTADRAGALIPSYVDALALEIQDALETVARQSGHIHSIYVGGGTPTVLSAAQLRLLLAPLKEFGVEFTVEAGRPDTVTAEKMKALLECGVTRVCINPQTFHQATLDAIGRGHTVADFYFAYGCAGAWGFSMNVDLIAGLPGETAAQFMQSVRHAVNLRPDNLTVHTLAYKRGAAIHEGERQFLSDAATMTAEARALLLQEGYSAYYLYRLKHMQGGLENTGYTLPGRACTHNIAAMEELASVIGCGAGAISKSVTNGLITRFPNYRDIRVYLDGYADLMQRKRVFFTK